MPKIDKNKVLIIGLTLVILTPSALALSFNLKYKDTSLPGLTLNGKSYTGMSREDAIKDLESAISDRYKDGMRLAYQDRTFTVSLAEIGYGIDTHQSIEKVFSYGHDADMLESAKEQISLFNTTMDLTNEISGKDFLIEENKWKEIAVVETPAKDFSYRFSRNDFAPVAAEEGFVIDQNKLRKDIENNLSNLKQETITLELIKDKPRVTEDKDQKALLQAKKLLTKTIILKYNSSSWKVTAEDFSSWISFAAQEDDSKKITLAPAPDKDQIKDYLISIVPQVNREPVNAQLEFKDGKVEVFSLSQDGIEMDMEASADKIGKEVFQEKNYTQQSGDGTLATANINQIPVELVVGKATPELTTDNIDNMGITSLLATGESNFRGSTKSRIHNITVGAGKFQGALIGPGDTFSFNAILGNVTAKEGYLPELVIKQGQTIPEYGGGLCQVSSTAFRAAVSAGMKITERKNHAYAVSYYSPQGTDATIYPPHPDLAFINNTPNYILIQTRISGTNLYFDFYGTDDGRKVETEGPVVYERGAGGAMKTWWKQRVYDKEGNLFVEDTFYSNYKSAALYPHTNPLE